MSDFVYFENASCRFGVGVFKFTNTFYAGAWLFIGVPSPVIGGDADLEFKAKVERT